MERLDSKIIAIASGDGDNRLYALCQYGSIWALTEGKGGNDRWIQIVSSGAKGNFGPGDIHFG